MQQGRRGSTSSWRISMGFADHASTPAVTALTKLLRGNSVMATLKMDLVLDSDATSAH